MSHISAIMRYLLVSCLFVSFIYYFHASILLGVSRWGQRLIFSWMSPASWSWHFITLHTAIAELPSMLHLRLWQRYGTQHIARKMQNNLLLVGSRKASHESWAACSEVMPSPLSGQLYVYLNTVKNYPQRRIKRVWPAPEGRLWYHRLFQGWFELLFTFMISSRKKVCSLFCKHFCIYVQENIWVQKLWLGTIDAMQYRFQLHSHLDFSETPRDFSPFAIKITGMASATFSSTSGREEWPKQSPTGWIGGKFVDTRIVEDEAGKPLWNRFQARLIWQLFSLPYSLTLSQKKCSWKGHNSK